MGKKVVFSFLLTCLLGVSPAFALDEPIVFPKEGQTKEQLSVDKSYCRDWAVEETGVNPEYVRGQLTGIKDKVMAEDESKMGGLFKGVFKGAATGAAVGAIDKNIGNQVGSDAVKGAVLGGVITHESQKGKAEEKEYRRDTLRQQELRDEYDKYMRAFSVCMDAKGYSVK